MSDAHAPSDRALDLLIVIASTRPGRIGAPVAHWFRGRAEQDPRYAVRTADLAEIDLPLMNEPHHPRLGKYTHEHTKAWSATVDAADAFVFVFPEYNHSFVAPLKNALDYLSAEWRGKPVGYVSYGGVSAGLRAAAALTPVVTTLGLRPVTSTVSIPRVKSFLGDDGEIHPNDIMNDAADAVLNGVAKEAALLRSLRQEDRQD